MVKHIILLIILSIAAIVFRTELGQVISALLYIHQQIASTLGLVFSNSPFGLIAQSVAALLIIPIIIGSIVALLFWLFKRAVLPHTMLTIWIVWVIMLIALISMGIK